MATPAPVQLQLPLTVSGLVLLCICLWTATTTFYVFHCHHSTNTTISSMIPIFSVAIAIKIGCITISKQECIPVGSVLSTVVALVGGAGCVSQLALGVGCIPGCTGQGAVWPGGVSAWGCLSRGCLPWGCVCPGGCLPGGCLSHNPVNRITDACENITLPQLCCRR